MSRIVCLTTNLTGMVHCGLEVVARLQQAGHDVTYACPWDISDKVKEQGFAYLQLPPINFDPGAELGGSLKQRRAAAIETLGMDDFAQRLDALQPDLLLIDIELHDSIVTAIAKRIPTLLLCQWFSIWRRPNLPPPGSEAIPGEGWRGQRLAIEFSWLEVRLRQLVRVWRTRLQTRFMDRASVLRHYARSIGFPSGELTEAYSFPPPMTYRSLPVLSMTAESLEFPHRARKGLQYVGPMVHANRAEGTDKPEVAQRLECLWDALRDESNKLICCTVTTMQSGDERFLERLIEAVSRQPHWQLAIGLGELAETFTRQGLPDNVHAFGWMPQLTILQRADCSINHAGINTINECIHFGVPMLIYSGKRYDQNGCAARIAFHGLGLRADKDTDDASMIEKRIERVLSESSFKDRVTEVSSSLREQQGDLARIVEEFINASKGD